MSINFEELTFSDKVSVALSELGGHMKHFYYSLAIYTIVTETEEENVSSDFITSRKLFDIRLPKSICDNSKKMAYAMLHETLHIQLGHTTRQICIKQEKRNKRVNDIILDSITNSIIEDIYNKPITSVFDVEEVWTLRHLNDVAKKYNVKWKYDENTDILYQTLEEWYEELNWLFELEDDQDGSGEGKGSGLEGDSDPNAQDHNFEVSNEGETSDKSDATSQMEGEMKERAIKSTMQEVSDKAAQDVAFDQDGASGSAFGRIMNGIRRPKKVLTIPAIMKGVNETNRVSMDSTYTINNPYSHIYGYKKKAYYNKPEPKCVVSIDVSGSLRQEDLDTIIDITGGIKASTDIVFWSYEDKILEANVYRDVNLQKRSDRKKLKPISLGGTDIKAMMNFIEEEYEKKNVYVILATDLCYRYEELPENVKGLFIVHLDEEQNAPMPKIAEKYSKSPFLKKFEYKRAYEMI